MSSFDMAEIARSILTAESPEEQAQMIEEGQADHREAVREAVEAEQRNLHDVIQYLSELGEIDQRQRELISEQLAAIRNGDDR